MEGAETAEDVAFLLDLFLKAVQDYVSVDLWHQYLLCAPLSCCPCGLISARAHLRLPVRA